MAFGAKRSSRKIKAYVFAAASGVGAIALLCTSAFMPYLARRLGEKGYQTGFTDGLMILGGAFACFCLPLCITIIFQIRPFVTRSLLLAISVGSPIGVLYGAQQWADSWLVGFSKYASERWNGEKIHPLVAPLMQAAEDTHSSSTISDEATIAAFTWNGRAASIEVQAPEGKPSIFHARWRTGRESEVGLLIAKDGVRPDWLPSDKSRMVKIDVDTWVYDSYR